MLRGCSEFIMMLFSQGSLCKTFLRGFQTRHPLVFLHIRAVKENRPRTRHSAVACGAVGQAKLQVSCGSALVSPTFSAGGMEGLRLLFSPGEPLGLKVWGSENVEDA